MRLVFAVLFFAGCVVFVLSIIGRMAAGHGYVPHASDAIALAMLALCALAMERRE